MAKSCKVRFIGGRYDGVVTNCSTVMFTYPLNGFTQLDIERPCVCGYQTPTLELGDDHNTIIYVAEEVV